MKRFPLLATKFKNFATQPHHFVGHWNALCFAEEPEVTTHNFTVLISLADPRHTSAVHCSHLLQSSRRDHTQTGNHDVPGVDGKARPACALPRPAPSVDVTARPLTPAVPPPSLYPEAATSLDHGEIRTGGRTSAGRGVLLFMGRWQVRGREWERRSEGWRGPGR